MSIYIGQHVLIATYIILFLVLYYMERTKKTKAFQILIISPTNCPT